MIHVEEKELLCLVQGYQLLLNRLIIVSSPCVHNVIERRELQKYLKKQDVGDGDE